MSGGKTGKISGLWRNEAVGGLLKEEEPAE